MSDNEYGKGEKMQRYSVRMPPSLWEAAMNKSGMIPLSVIIRRLVEMWIKGEIKIMLSGDDETHSQN